MSTLKSHLVDVHKHLSAHHASMAEHTDALSKCLAKAMQPPNTVLAENNKDSRAALDAMTAQHLDMAAFHSGAADACEKAAQDELAKGNQIMPSGVSGVAPERPTIRAVPRHGSPTASEKPTVPYEFQKLVQVDEDDERWAQG
jgi:hypothetical protein